MAPDWRSGPTVCSEEVVEQLEEWEAVPALGGLDLQRGVHVDGVKSQEVLRVLHHEVCPPRKRLERQHEEEGRWGPYGQRNTSGLETSRCVRERERERESEGERKRQREKDGGRNKEVTPNFGLSNFRMKLIPVASQRPLKGFLVV